jgi:translocator protein
MHDDQPRPTRIVGLGVFMALAYAAAGIGTLVQGDDVAARYLALDPPAWAPPAGMFGPVWSVLYALIGVAGWRVWRAAGGVAPAGRALGLWGVQLVVNAVWPGVFFGAEALVPALGVIVLLDLLVIATIAAARRHDPWAAWLLLPYLAWILYATALNAALAVG